MRCVDIIWINPSASPPTTFPLPRGPPSIPLPSALLPQPSHKLHCPRLGQSHLLLQNWWDLSSSPGKPPELVFALFEENCVFYTCSLWSQEAEAGWSEDYILWLNRNIKHFPVICLCFSVALWNLYTHALVELLRFQNLSHCFGL